MPASRSMRLVRSALRCYPRRWRSRHGAEAAEIATLLIRDGTPAWSVAWSYLIGAARTRLVIEPRRRLGAALGADHKAVQRWHGQAIDMIVAALSRA